MEGGNLAEEFSPLSIDDNRISSPGPHAVRQAETSSSREDLIAENLVQASRVASGVESGTELSADNLVGDEASEEGDNLVGSEEVEEVEADQSESRRVMREEEVTSERDQTALNLVEEDNRAIEGGKEVTSERAEINLIDLIKAHDVTTSERAETVNNIFGSDTAIEGSKEEKLEEETSERELVNLIEEEDTAGKEEEEEEAVDLPSSNTEDGLSEIQSPTLEKDPQ